MQAPRTLSVDQFAGGMRTEGKAFVTSPAMAVGHEHNHHRLPGVTTTRLQRSRRAAGLRQVDLASRAGVHLNTIKLLEAGAHVPKVRTAVAIARALGHTSPLALFDLEEVLTPTSPRGEADR